ncbi:hypothetical protein BDF20DRAFT_867658 [Mycotypha africana]|uniref:uncharacterized protein n=1 Tax=Mycotypha africana TaxID=64632 RepID=UPI002300B5D7|nr:uncharacterized protein BDF20DRAFT_867658 [Mycotypha africana]KAI8979113.1 hypothetical protein BDF20DRAFT_867658 [Mycotypha africana]
MVEAQKDINEKYMCRAVKYSTLVYEKYGCFNSRCIQRNRVNKQHTSSCHTSST